MPRPPFTPSASTPVRYVDAHVHFWDQSEPGIDWPMLEPNFRFPLHRFNESGHYNAADHRAESAGVPVSKVVHVQAAVIGLPDPALGERCCAVVVVRDAADPLSLPEMVDFLKTAGLMMQKIPEQLEIMESLPRTPTGKVLKLDLKRALAR